MEEVVEETDTEHEGVRCGASGEASSKWNAFTISSEWNSVDARHGIGACVLLHDDIGLVLPLIVFELR